MSFSDSTRCESTAGKLTAVFRSGTSERYLGGKKTMSGVICCSLLFWGWALFLINDINFAFSLCVLVTLWQKNDYTSYEVPGISGISTL